MDTGAVRSISEQSPINSGETGEFQPLSDSELRTATGKRTSDNGTPSKSTSSGATKKRTSLRVTDREDAHKVTEGTQPEKKTPPPKQRTSTKQVLHYLTDTEAQNRARGYLALIEMGGVAVAGPNGEMSEFERTMMTPAMKRTLARIPIEYLEKGNIVFDTMLLVGGLGMYLSRVGKSIPLPRRKQSKGVQNDVEAPVAAEVENVVIRTQPGDLDGIAVPVPQVFKQYMDAPI